MSGLDDGQTTFCLERASHFSVVCCASAAARCASRGCMIRYSAAFTCLGLSVLVLQACTLSADTWSSCMRKFCIRHPTAIRAPEDSPTTPSGRMDFVDFWIRCVDVKMLGAVGFFFARVMGPCISPGGVCADTRKLASRLFLREANMVQKTKICWVR